MDRALWQQHISTTQCPKWTCPACQDGTLKLVSDSLVFRETTQSRLSHDDPDWDPDWVHYLFTAWARCDNANCLQDVTISGTGGVFAIFDHQHGINDFFDDFVPLTCNPMPDMIHVPKRCPDNVASQLRAAFSVFWMDPQACAAHVRVALEFLLDHAGVMRTTEAKGGKTRDLSLHERIAIYQATDAVMGAQLMALKWLGNAGSHSAAVDGEHLLWAFEVLEHVLGEIVDRRSEHIAGLAVKLHEKFAPR